MIDMPPLSNQSDLLDKGDSLIGDTSITPVRHLAAELFLRDHSRSLADQRHLTLVLGLDEMPRETRREPGPRVAPHPFRRSRKPGGRHG